MYLVKCNRHKSNSTFKHTILSYKTTGSKLTDSTQQQPTDDADGRHLLKIHDKNKQFVKNYFSRSSSIFQTAIKALFNSRHHQTQVRHTCSYGQVHSFKISVLLRKHLNTLISTESSAADARIYISATSNATTEQKRTRRDDKK